MRDPLAILDSTHNRKNLLIVAFALVMAIAYVDWRTEPYVSLGFLYLFPVMVVSGFLSRKQIVVAGGLCAVLQEAFSHLPENEALVRLILSSAGYIGTGLFISELRNRHLDERRHLSELRDQTILRREAEAQLQILVESSPAAIVTIDLSGRILLANHAAHQLLAPDVGSLQGRAISSYLPALQTVVQTETTQVFRTALHCTGSRSNGEVFLAGVWFSTYTTASGPRLAAIIVYL